jgi:hypothetical protein
MNMNSEPVALEANIGYLVHVLNEFSKLGPAASRNVATGMCISIDALVFEFTTDVL